MRRSVVKAGATSSRELRDAVAAARNRSAARRKARCRPGLERLEARVTPALAFNLSTLPVGVVGVAYPNGPGQPVQFSVQGGTGDYTYSLGDKVLNNDDTDNQYALIDATLPAGMTFSDGLLGSTPQQAGVFTLVVQASDSSGVAVSEAYSLTITALAGNPNSITLATGNTDPATFAAGTVGTPYTAQG